MAHRAVVLVVVALATACGGSEPEDNTAAEAPATIVVSDVVAAPSTDGAAFVYMSIENESADLDRLVGASILGCTATELHETPSTGGSADMRPPAEGIAIPPQATVRFGPQALHVMCIGGAEAWSEGDEVPITLEFQNAGPVDAVAVVGPSLG